MRPGASEPGKQSEVRAGFRQQPTVPAVGAEIGILHGKSWVGGGLGVERSVAPQHMSRAAPATPEVARAVRVVGSVLHRVVITVHPRPLPGFQRCGDPDDHPAHGPHLRPQLDTTMREVAMQVDRGGEQRKLSDDDTERHSHDQQDEVGDHVIPPTSPLQLEPTAPSPPARREAYVAATPQVASPVTPATQRPRGRLGVSQARRTATRSRSRTFGVSHSSNRNPPASNASCNAMRRLQQLAHGRLVVLVRSRVACVRPSPVGRAHGPIGFPGAGGISGPVCVRPSPRHLSLLSWVLASCARPSSSSSTAEPRWLLGHSSTLSR